VIILASISGAAVIAVAVLLLTLYEISQRIEQTPLPQIMLYYDKYYKGHLQHYDWNGTSFPNLEGEEIPYYPEPIINVTFGESVMFQAMNSTTGEPSYYLVSINELENSSSYPSSKMIVDQLNIGHSPLVIGQSNGFLYFEPHKRYQLDVVGIWLMGNSLYQKQSSVNYSFFVDTMTA
jgi:hypothetical protein